MKFKINQTKDKLRGGYYTPIGLAKFISKWVCQDSFKILEPSCGDGVFIDAINTLEVKDINLLCIERDSNEAKKARKKINNLNTEIFSNLKVITKDFLDWSINKPNESFDGVIGNPPFIRYQFLEPDDQHYSQQIFKRNKLKFTKHTNAWVPFVISSLNLLNPGGRLGMIIPAELLTVIHSGELRKFLIDECSEINIIDPMDIWFKDTLQGVIILFVRKKINNLEKNIGLNVLQVKGDSFLNKNPSTLFKKSNYISVDLIQNKWILGLLTIKEITTLNKVLKNKNIFNFNDIASVSVGIVTGANDFFLVDTETVKKYNLSKYSYPMFGRSNHCKGVIYNKLAHSNNEKKGYPTNFLWFKERITNKSVKNYIKSGEEISLNERYKCRIRSPWYEVPSVYNTKLAMLKRCNNIPRLIYNSLKAFTTDTAYRIESKEINNKLLSFCFINPLTALISELEGRSYGGGVLELVPSEIRRLYIPILPNGSPFNLEKLNKKFLNDDNIDEILLEQSKLTLGAIGVSSEDQMIIFNAMIKLRNRRKKNLVI